MKLHLRIITARQQKGFTQEELADLSGVSVRTIQRIESGDAVPRSYTIKAIAKTLERSYEELTGVEAAIPVTAFRKDESRDRHFLQLFNLSCFAYLVIPWVHFMIPNYLLKKENDLQQETIEYGRRLVRQQIYWTVILHLAMLLTLAYNLIRVAASGNRDSMISYLWPFLVMYLLNAVMIFVNASRIVRRS